MSAIVLCLACGMQVLPLADGSCPSCGARGSLGARVWYGRHIQALIPNRSADTDRGPRYGCLYLRPFASKFRAPARLQAVARAMHPLGTTVALHAGEARWGLGPVRSSPLLQSVVRIPRIGLVIALPVIAWNLSVVLIEFVERRVFRWRGIELVDVIEDRWRPTFRQLAFRSRMIVMDVSSATAGIAYEEEFIADLKLGDRLVLLHNGHPAARQTAEQQVERFRANGLRVPLVPYNVWRIRQLTSDLREIANQRSTM